MKFVLLAAHAEPRLASILRRRLERVKTPYPDGSTKSQGDRRRNFATLQRTLTQVCGRASRYGNDCG